MRLLGYLRVSTDDQANSLDEQRRLIAQYCAMYGHVLVEVLVDDGISAGIDLDRRPAGRALLARLAAGDADGLVVKELDRAFRLAVDGLLTVDRFNAAGWDIHAVFDRIDTSTPDGWAALALKLVMGEWERRKIQHRTTLAMQALKRASRVYGPVPFGCVRLGDALRRDPAIWAVREIIVQVAARHSLREACKQLRRDGILNPSGGRLWHVSTLQRILRTHSELNHIPLIAAAPEAAASISTQHAAAVRAAGPSTAPQPSPRLGGAACSVAVDKKRQAGG